MTGQHDGDGPAERRSNRLAGETSPYLLQHAHNPVDWYPWGTAALAKARDEDKPIFLSIGYAACHWCHVMERESFEDEATAEQLNRDFVAVKVDREERPDLDAIYMSAVQAMTGQGGWPMSVFLTPDGRPFYGGTYFPNRSFHGMPAFRDVLTGVAEAWRERRPEIESSSTRLAEAITDQAGAAGRTSGDGLRLQPALLDAAVAGLERTFDATHGGWGGAPKFPAPMTIEFLLRRFRAAGDGRALAMARRTLDRMADGGIHDQLGGGFHRYATDGIWLVPHFEQMLYDNAQLARVYLHAWQLTGDARYRTVAVGTIDYVLRELTTADGGFAASQDADTAGVEGATFTWTLDELTRFLDAADPSLTPLFLAAHGVTAAGNWEGRTILARARSDEELADAEGLTEDEIRDRLGRAAAILLAERARRAQPARDDKVLASWNGLMLGALADASRAFRAAGEGELAERYRAAAERAATTVLDGLRAADGRLGRSWKDGRATGAAVLEDHANLAEGLLALYEATFDERWFTVARELMEIVLEHFGDPAGGFFDTADDHERLVARPKDLQDNALPSGNAMAVLALLRLHALTGESRYREAAERAMTLVAGFVPRYPTAFGWWLVAIDLALASVAEVAIVGGLSDPGTAALVSVVESGFRPHQVVAASAAPGTSAVPLLADRSLIDGRPAAYVCRGFVCRRPVTDPAALAEELAGT